MRIYWDEDCDNYCLDYSGETYELEGGVEQAHNLAWKIALVDTLEALNYCVEAMKRYPQEDLDYQDALEIADYMVKTERTGNITRNDK